MTTTIYDIIGIAGSALVVGSYVALQIERLDPKRAAYSGANAVGAGLILVSLSATFNLAAFVVELFWLLASVLGLVRLARRRDSAA